MYTFIWIFSQLVANALRYTTEVTRYFFAKIVRLCIEFCVSPRKFCVYSRRFWLYPERASKLSNRNLSAHYVYHLWWYMCTCISFFFFTCYAVWTLCWFNPMLNLCRIGKRALILINIVKFYSYSIYFIVSFFMMKSIFTCLM